MSRRKGRPPNLSEKLAAALLQLEAARAELVGRQPIVTWEQSKKLSPRQITAHFELDHHPVAVWITDGVPCNAPWNLTWLPKAEHRMKTNKRDTPAAAKSKRIIAKREKKPTGRTWGEVLAATDFAAPLRRKPKSKYRRKLNGRVELRHDPW